MLDPLLRPVKDRALAPLVIACGDWAHPHALSLAGFAAGFACVALCAVSARGGPEWRAAALALWLLCRVIDGLDGAVARRQGRASDLGGYLDIMLDFAIYALIPIGVTLGATTPFASSPLAPFSPAAPTAPGALTIPAVPPDVAALPGLAGPPSLWLWLALLLASYYVNAASWMYLSALLEKRGRALPAGGGPVTSIVMPTGLIEGTETIVLYALFILFPAYLVPLFAAATLLVCLTIAQRIAWALTHL